MENINMRREILRKVAEFYQREYSKRNIYIPNKSIIHCAGRVFDEKELINLVDSSLDFWLTHGRYSCLFEKNFAKLIGVNHCALVNSGSSANLLAFMALTVDALGKRKIKRGDEIITVATAFPTTVAPIVQYGAIPVFVDITPDTYNIDTKQLKKAISKRTKAVMLAHTLGNPFEVNTVKDFCNNYGLWLIEDNCDSLGSKYGGRYTGSFGDIATSSFYPAHHITTGEGGAVYTDNSLLAKAIVSLRDWGRDCCCDTGKDDTCGKRFSQQLGKLPFGYDHKYTYSYFGYNLKATEMQAAIGCAQLEKLPFFIKKRKENFNELYDGLNDLRKYFLLPKATDKSEPSWFGFILTIKQGAVFTRSDIVSHLEANKIQCRFIFAGNIVRQPCFDMLQKNKDYRVIGDLKHTDNVMNNSFWVGVYPGLNKIMLKKITNTIRMFMRRKT